MSLTENRFLNSTLETDQTSKKAPLTVASSYVPALDGLRAVAILGVLVFHAVPKALPGGFTGVDVFFVLSGYLITSIILRDASTKNFSIKEFYLRRVQRLLPNAVFMVLVTICLAQVVLLPSNAAKVADHGIWTVINLSNIYILQHIGGYWGNLSDSSPLLHTWSLAVEEQFYLVFPAIFLLLFRTKRLLTLLVLLTVASFTLSVYGTYWHPVGTFYWLPTRAWELLLGAVFAIFSESRTGARLFEAIHIAAHKLSNRVERTPLDYCRILLVRSGSLPRYNCPCSHDWCFRCPHIDHKRRRWAC